MELQIASTVEDGAPIINDAKYEYLRPFVERIVRQGRDYVRWYVDTGRTLREARTACKRGHWGPFLESVAIEERTAQRMMECADNVETNPALMEDRPTVRKLLAAGDKPKTKSKAKSKSKPKAKDKTEKADTVSDGACSACGAPHNWRAMALAGDIDALMAAAEAAAAAEAEAA